MTVSLGVASRDAIIQAIAATQPHAPQGLDFIHSIAQPEPGKQPSAGPALTLVDEMVFGLVRVRPCFRESDLEYVQQRRLTTPAELTLAVVQFLGRTGADRAKPRPERPVEVEFFSGNTTSGGFSRVGETDKLLGVHGPISVQQAQVS